MMWKHHNDMLFQDLHVLQLFLLQLLYLHVLFLLLHFSSSIVDLICVQFFKKFFFPHLL